MNSVMGQVWDQVWCRVRLQVLDELINTKESE